MEAEDAVFKFCLNIRSEYATIFLVKTNVFLRENFQGKQIESIR